MPISIPTPFPWQPLSFPTSLQSSPSLLFLRTKLSPHSLSRPPSSTSTIVRMGGGPRTYPGGVSKWQWKRMQAKKAKQLLRARLFRERQIYEMRKRAQLKAAVSEFERPWVVVQKAPNLFSVSADEELKVLSDRFQKPGGFDMWSERDGPKLFETVEKKNGVNWRRVDSAHVGFDRKQREEENPMIHGSGGRIKNLYV
ncbi:hypothetical protein SLEP1_g21485 [Rubroshorea leprosula]|uniref:Uncharacterized protein n=1 Tax=Rubroshorea leprosula TaxID=152421 RepID=A0AAV5JC69_9ROSI|nr:hypothetical protein SLEP1_g21485 [Rubroshorea leprosula]